MYAQEFIGNSVGTKIGARERSFIPASLTELGSFNQTGLKHEIYAPPSLYGDFVVNHQKPMLDARAANSRSFKSPFLLRPGGAGRSLAVTHEVDLDHFIVYGNASDAASLSLDQARQVQADIYFAGYRNTTCVQRQGHRSDLPESDFKFALEQEIPVCAFCEMVKKNADETGAKYRILRIDSCWPVILARFCVQYLPDFVILALGEGLAFPLSQSTLSWLAFGLPFGTVGSRVFLRLRASGALCGKHLREFDTASSTAHEREYSNPAHCPRNGRFHVVTGPAAESTAELTFDEAFGAAVEPPYDACAVRAEDEPDLPPPEVDREVVPGCEIQDNVIDAEAGEVVDPGLSADDLHERALSGLLWARGVDFGIISGINDTELSEAAAARGLAMRGFFDDVLGACDPPWRLAPYAVVARDLPHETRAQRDAAAALIRATRAPPPLFPCD